MVEEPGQPCRGRQLSIGETDQLEDAVWWLQQLDVSMLYTLNSRIRQLLKDIERDEMVIFQVQLWMNDFVHVKGNATICNKYTNHPTKDWIGVTNEMQHMLEATGNDQMSEDQ